MLNRNCASGAVLPAMHRTIFSLAAFGAISGFVWTFKALCSQTTRSRHTCWVICALCSLWALSATCEFKYYAGMNLGHMSKMLKCASNDDIITIKADDNGDSVTFMFESPQQDKISDFELKASNDSYITSIYFAESLQDRVFPQHARDSSNLRSRDLWPVAVAVDGH